jgi:bacteriorhodopsin
MSKPQSVTSVGQSPDEERRERMTKYLISQIVRVACIILAVTVHGWLMWLFFAGAIFLPYFAVVLANAKGEGEVKSKPTSVVAPTLRISADAFVSTTMPPKTDENKES